MKRTAERETSKSTPGYSGRELRVPSHSDKRYIYRNDYGYFIARPNGHSSKHEDEPRIISSSPSKLDGRKLVGSVLISYTQSLSVAPPIEEAPDFTNADKEWIDRIDSSQLSWEDW
jgi:hypothetical protein